MKLHEEFKLYENMWDEAGAETMNPYVVLNRSAKGVDTYKIFTVTTDLAEAIKIYDEAQRKYGFRSDHKSTQIKDGKYQVEFSDDVLDLVQFFDLSSFQYKRLAACVNKKLNSHDYNFISSLYNSDNYNILDPGLVKVQRAGKLDSDGKIKSDTTPEFEILYKDHSGNSDEVSDVLLYADNAKIAEEYFWEYICDPESYDDGEPVDPDDIEILSIKPTGEFY
jgi:hypothetical protein